jgi:class 3 adenylate cyclase/tetratricopeptide (TPR) repeat protein
VSRHSKPGQINRPQLVAVPPNAVIEGLHAERRQLTIVFVDLVGSTPLSERIDPEEFFAIIRSYRDICDEKIRQYGGHIARLVGDGLLAYFGVPQAHENDPERAVRASLAIAAAIKERKFQISDRSFLRLRVRIGVNTGFVVVGSVPGEPPDRREVFGSSAHVAARLQAIAGENGVVIGAATYELIRGIFDCVSLGRRRLKGVNDPVEAWRVNAVTPGESRFDRSRSAPLPRMIGRTSEAGILAELWEKSMAGSSHVGVISGEPGIGKSRLIREFRGSLDQSAIDVLSHQCSPFHVSTPFAPEIERLMRATGIQEADDPRLSIAKLRSLLKKAMLDVDRALRYYGALLSIPACPGYEPADLGAPSERERAFQAIAETLAVASRNKPIITISEDVQWIDPTSITLLKRTIARCARERVLFLVTHRDDYEPTWLSGPTVRSIPLQKLTEAECERMVATIEGAERVSRRITRQIVERTDGVPLFIEEVTRAVVDSGAMLNSGAGAVPKGELPAPLVPATIHDSLMERLDRLGNAKRVAQVASVFGRQFESAGVASMLSNHAGSLKRSLDALEGAGIVYRINELQRTLFAFKHAMIQEAAYGSLLKEERSELHARAAAWLVQRAATGETSPPAVLGYHYERAGNIPEAIDAWLNAGKSARRRSATKEAVAHLREGISLLSRLPPSPRRHEAELALQTNLAMAYTANAGWSDPNVYGPYSVALKLCAKYGTIQEKTTVLWGVSVAKMVNCELSQALEHTRKFVELAREWRDGEATLVAYTSAMIANFYVGRLRKAAEFAGLIRASYKSKEHGKLVQKYQHDPLVVAQVYSGHIEWLLGRPRQARAACDAARRLANDIGHPFMMAFAHTIGANDHWYEGDLASNLICVEQGMKTAAEYGYPMYQVIGPLWATRALTDRGPAPLVIEKLCGLMAKLPPDDRCIKMPVYKTMLAQEFSRIGEQDRALALVASAEALIGQTGERWAAPEIYRIHGSLLCSGPGRDDETAIRLFRRSLASARRLEAVGWELRTSISLTRLLMSTSGSDRRRAEARDALKSVRARFPADETSADLREADELIGQL